MKEGFLESHGVSYRISDIRHGAPVLVFLHGLSGSISAWYEYESRFEKDYTMLAIDLRGHGLSRRPARYSDYDPKKLAEDVSALFDHLHINNCVLISHSLGTLVALELSRMRDAYMPMIVMSPNFEIRRIFLRRIFQPMLSVLASIFDLMPHIRMPHVRTDYSNYIGTGDYNVRRIIADIWNTTLRVYIYCLVQVYEQDTDPEWKSISVPVLVIQGENDGIIPLANATNLSETLPHAKLAVLKGANHILVLNNVEEVSQLITEFVQEVSHAELKKILC